MSVFWGVRVVDKERTRVLVVDDVRVAVYDIYGFEIGVRGNFVPVMRPTMHMLDEGVPSILQINEILPTKVIEKDPLKTIEDEYDELLLRLDEDDDSDRPKPSAVNFEIA